MCVGVHTPHLILASIANSEQPRTFFSSSCSENTGDYGLVFLFCLVFLKVVAKHMLPAHFNSS